MIIAYIYTIIFFLRLFIRCLFSRSICVWWLTCSALLQEIDTKTTDWKLYKQTVKMDQCNAERQGKPTEILREPVCTIFIYERSHQLQKKNMWVSSIFRFYKLICKCASVVCSNIMIFSFNYLSFFSHLFQWKSNVESHRPFVSRIQCAVNSTIYVIAITQTIIEKEQSLSIAFMCIELLYASIFISFELRISSDWNRRANNISSHHRNI